ncbi:putative AT-hook motif nuclear-localized protein [Helianthus anomalus]
MSVKHWGDWDSSSVGARFVPHIINVHTGEDVTMKVTSFSQHGPSHICILPDSVGGSVAGLLVAASPVQIIVGSFLTGVQQEQKPAKKQKPDNITITLPTTTMVPVQVLFSVQTSAPVPAGM